MRKFVQFIFILLAAVIVVGCEGSRNVGNANLEINLKLPEDYQKVFLIQTFKTNSLDELTKLIKYARITVEGRGIKHPISKLLPFGYSMDIIVPAGKNRFFTVSLMDKNKNVIFAGAKEVPFIPAGQEITLNVRLYFARSFTDQTNDLYPLTTTGLQVYDLRDVSILWGTDQTDKELVTISMTFNKNVLLYKGENSNGLMGIIEIDADRNPSTGIPSLVDSLRPESMGKIGVDYILYLEGFSDSKALLVNVKNGESRYVPLKIIDTHILVTVPAQALKISQIGNAYMYVDAAFISYLKNREFVDIFPDMGAAVSTDLASLFIKKDFFSTIKKFVVKQSIPVASGSYINFIPFHTHNIFAGLYIINYSSGNTSEVKLLIKDLMRNKDIVKNLGEFKVNYFYPSISVKGNIIALVLSAYGIAGCSGSTGYEAYISFDGGYSFRVFDKGCVSSYKVDPIFYGDNLILTNEVYGLKRVKFKKFHIYPDHLGSEVDMDIDQSGLENPIYFSINNSLYQAGITITNTSLSVKLYQIGPRILKYELPITSFSAGTNDISGSIDRVWIFNGVVYIDVNYWVGYNEDISVLYGLEFQGGSVDKVFTMPLKKGMYIEDLFEVNNKPILFIREDEKTVNGVVPALYMLDGTSKIYIAKGKTSSDYFYYFGSWLIPPATPVVFWESSTTSGDYFNVSVGLP